MKVGQCPSCGAPVEFEAGSARIKVCEHCRTVVARDGAKLESLGKVAELADTESPLRVGISGKYQGTGFRIAGRIQKSHGKGTWDEWCLQLDDARTAWLSESEGAWNLMFELPQVQAPALAQVKPLTPFLVGDKRFLVEEVGHAATVSAEGELPDFHRKHAYADATGPSGVFGSIDYGSDKPVMYVGSTVSLAQLGFATSDLQPTPRRQALAQARCTNCNGPLDLKAPDSTRRVACPYCGALLDVSAGKLTLLQLLEKPPYEARLKLGSKAKLKDVEWTVLAFLIRSCRVEGTRYPWEEYLLWNRDHGFRWLMMSNGHWTFLTPIPAGECLFGGRVAKFSGDETGGKAVGRLAAKHSGDETGGKAVGRLAARHSESFKQFQSTMATTEWVQGECYWEIEKGEQAFSSEYVAAPRSLNVDQTENEATVTLGEMMTRDEVGKAFGLDPKKLPWPQGVAPAQVNPWSERSSSSWKWAGMWGAGLLAVFVTLTAMSVSGKYAEKTIPVPADAKAGSPEVIAFSEPFEIKDSTPLEVSVYCPDLSNSWCGVQVDLVNEKTDEVVSVYAEPSYYFGTDSDGSWTEGSKDASKDTDTVEAGSYVMRTTISFDKPVQTYVVKVTGSSGPGACCFLFFLLLLFIYPVVATAAAGSFETRKWQDSVFQPPHFGGAK